MADRRTDRQTANTALTQRRAGKNGSRHPVYAHLGVIVIPRLILDLGYLFNKFDDCNVKR